jgi:hypothetical protein
MNFDEYLYLRKYGITLREGTFVAQGLQQIAIEGPLSISSPLIIEKSSLTLKNLSLWTLKVSDSQVSLEGCSFPEGKDFPSPRLEIVSSEVALEGVRIAGGKVGIHVRDSRLILREVSLTGLEEVGMRVGGQTEVKGEQISIRQCGRGMEVRSGARVQLTRPTLRENGTGIAVAEAALVLKGPGALTHHRGPAILVEKSGSLSAEELTFEKNQRDDSTAQIHLVGAYKVSLQKITVQNGDTIGLYAKDCPDIRMADSIFTLNLYGAIHLVKSRLIANEVKILENGGERYYWQVALSDHAHLKIEKSSIEHGRSLGILAVSSKVEIADCIVAHHQYSKGMGLCAENCPDIRIINSTFTSNLRGAIILVKSRLVASEVKILQNGGVVGEDYYWQVALLDNAHLKIEKSSIEHSECGGILTSSSEVEISNCIVAHHQLDGLHVRDSSTAKVVGGTFRANRGSQIAGYNNSTVEVRGAVLDGDDQSEVGLSMQESHVAITKCQIHSHNQNGVWVEGGSECIIEDSQLENNGLGSSEENTYAQLFIKEVKKVVLSALRVIGGKGIGVSLESCKASFVGKSIIGGNQFTGLWAGRTQLSVENVEFQDNGKGSTPNSYWYQILADEASNVQLKEVRVYEEQHSGGIWVRKRSIVKLEGGSIHGHGREAIAVQDSGSKIVVIGARIFGNAQQGGAQVIVKENGTAEMEDTCIQDSRHGGVLVEDGGTLILKRCQVHNNKAYNLKREGTGRVEFIDMPPPVEDSSAS